MKSIKQINREVKQGLEALIYQQKQQHLCHQEKLREQVVTQYLQFNASLSEQEKDKIRAFIALSSKRAAINAAKKR